MAQLAGNLQSRGEPVELLGRRQHVAHHLDQTLARGDIGHPLGILVRQFEKQRVLVAEVVKYRTPRQADPLLQPAHRRPVVAELGEAAAGAVKDLTAAGRQMILADLGHGPLDLHVATRRARLRRACDRH